MKVSVIVPVYNVEKYIGKCLESLVRQTLKEIEIIVINDGSLDNSQKIIDKYVKKYPKKIISIIKENGGLGSARNVGLNYAKGEYISFVDSDDFINDDMLEIMYRNAKKSNSDIAICGNNVIDEKYKILKSETALENKNINNNILKYKLAVWNKLYKKDLLLNSKIKFRTNVWYEDVDFTTKIMLMAKSVVCIDKPLYNYMLRIGSIMNNSNLIRNKELCLSFDEIIDYCQRHNIYKKHYHEIEFLCIYNMYICGISRILRIKNDNILKKKIIDNYIKYLNKNFKNFKKNKYLKFLPTNKKIVYKLLNYKMYFIIKLLYIIKK